MTYGPIQFLVLGFEGNRFSGKILPALEAVMDSGIIRLIGSLVVKKDPDGEVEVLQVSELSEEEMAELAAIAGGLVGLGEGGILGALRGAEEAVEAVAAKDYFGFDDEDIDDIIDQLPPNYTAGIMLFEHTWAIPFKEAVLEAGGDLIAQGMISPAALVQLGAMLADEEEWD